MKKIKLLLLLVIIFGGLFVFTGKAEAATLYAKTAGGNWSSANTWSNISSAGVDNSGPPAATDDVIFDIGSGNVTIDTTTCVAKTLTMTGYAGVLTHSSAQILTVSGNITLAAGTYSPADSTANLRMGATGTLTTAGNGIGRFTNTSGITTLGDNFTGIASMTAQFIISGTSIDLNGKTLSGNSIINRLLVTSGTLGSGKTLTVSSGTFANADFRDINFANGGVNLDLSAISGLSGDAGGNGMSGGGTLTLTAATTQTWQGTSGGNWSVNTNWTSRVPLPQDDVVINTAFSASQTVTANMPRLGKNINWTGTTGSPTWANAESTTIYGSLTLISGMSLSATTGATYTFEGRDSFTLTSADKSFLKNVTVQMIGGTLTLQDNLSLASSVDLVVNNGTFNANNFNVTASRFLSTLNNTRAVTMGSGTWTLTVDSGTPWNIGNTGTITFNANTSTISITSTSVNTKTFAGAGLTYYNFSATGGGTGAIIFTGSNTFNTITIGAPKTVQFTAGTTQTTTNFVTNGSSGNVITITSDTTGTHTLTKAGGGIVTGDWLNIQHSIATPADTWYAGPNSINNQAVVTAGSGWIFDSSAPSGGSITYTDGYYVTASVDLTVADGTDSESGINTSSRIIQRKSATLSGGTCGSYGSFGTITPTGTYPNFTDSTVVSGNCYQYQYLVSDNVGNQATYTSANTAKIDTVAPTVPGTPSTSSASNNTKPTWTWTASTDSASGLATTPYTVQWCTDSSFTGCSGNTDTSSTNSHTHSTALTDGTWYFRVKATDAAGNSSAFSSNGSFTLATSTPTGSISINSGASYTNSSSVTLNISATDSVYASSNLSMKISNLSDLSDASYESFSTTKTWTLASPTTDGTKTVYIRFKNPGGNESQIYSASITLDTVAPSGVELVSPDDNSYTNNERPTFKWKASTDATSGMSKYRLDVDNGGIGNFAIDGIPASGTSDYETSKYLVHFDGFSDSDTTNNYIFIYTKHSIDWDQIGENDGKLKEGKRSWKITAYDNAGNTSNSSRTLYADFTNPTLTNVVFANSDILGTSAGYTVISNPKPTIEGLISDNLSPNKIEVSFYKQNFFLGIETNRTLFVRETFDLNNSTNKTSLNFSVTPSQYLDYGKFIVDVTGIDKAGNRSESKSLNLWLLSDEKAKLLLTQGKTAEEQQNIIDKLREKSQVSLPELEKKAVLRRGKEAAEFDRLIKILSDSIAYICRFGENYLSFVWDTLRTSTSAIATTIKETRLLACNTFSSALNHIFYGIIDTTNAIAENINDMADFIGSSYQQTAKTAPELVRNSMLAFGYFNHSIATIIDESEDHVKHQINETQKDMGENLRIQISNINIATQNVINNTSTIAEVNLVISIGFNNSQEMIKREIAQTHHNTSNIILNIGTRARNGFNIALHSVTKPAVESKNFADRLITSTTIAVATFESYMFDSTPTRIDNVALLEVGKDYAVVYWKTNHYTRSNKVNYGQTLTYGQSAWGKDGEKDHTIRITGLKPGAKYYFEVMSQNKNYAYDAYYSFETKH